MRFLIAGGRFRSSKYVFRDLPLSDHILTKYEKIKEHFWIPPAAPRLIKVARRLLLIQKGRPPLNNINVIFKSGEFEGFLLP